MQNRPSLYSANLKWLTTFVSAISIAFACTSAKADDAAVKAAEELAGPAIELTFSTLKFLWVSSRKPSLPEGMPPTVYSNLAVKIQQQIDEGRAAAEVGRANADLVKSALTYVAVTNPEPLTKVAAGIAAFAAKKTGDFIVEAALEKSQDHVLTVLASGLESSGLTDAKLKSMNHEQIAAAVEDFKVGGKQMKEILDDPKALRLIQDHMIDIVSDNALEALRRTEVVEKSVDEIRKDVRAAFDEITKVGKALEDKTKRLETTMGELADAVSENAKQLSTLRGEVEKNTKSLASIAEISFSGWTTAQKLQAVRSDLFPDLKGEQKDSMIASLESQQKQEKLISQASSIAGDLQSISRIASDLNMPKEIIEATSAASTIATGAAQFLSGNYLGALQSITSLGGMGKPDPDAERHNQMMTYLGEQFAYVNRQLANIIDLQVKTIEALDDLRKEQQAFREEVRDQLNRIESITLVSNRILQALIRKEWIKCDALVNGTPLNGKFVIKNREQLLKLFSDGTPRGNAVSCYSTMSDILNARVLPLDWGGEAIDASVMPSVAVPGDEQTHGQLIKLQQLDQRAYRSASNLLLTVLGSEDMKKPARVLARLAQPMASADDQQKYRTILQEPETDKSLVSFKCDDTKTLSIALKELLCFVPTGTSHNPRQVPRLFGKNTAMLGPQVERVIELGMLVATLTDLSFDTRNDQIQLVKAADLEGIGKRSLSKDLRAAIKDRNGLNLLLGLSYLAEAFVLQQSIMYGDYTAQIAEEALYDKETKTLNPTPTDPAAKVKAQAALEAIKANPVLARNVVLLALRHAIADSQGGFGEAEKVNYLEREYRWAYMHFVDGDRCGNDEIALWRWKRMFPGWNIEYRASRSEKAGDAKLANCPDAQTLDLGGNPQLDLGSGPSLKLTQDFYVTLPSSMEMSIGRFEQPVSLLRALALRDKVNQAIGERNMSETIAATVSEYGDPEAMFKRVSLHLLDAGVLPAAP